MTVIASLQQASPWRRLIASSAPPRFVGLDIARGLAVIGMIAAHVAEPGPGFRWSDLSSWADLVNGRPSILFALLAGISIALMTGRVQRPTSEQMPRIRLQLIGRGITIFIIGLLLEQLGTSVLIILTLYGILYVVALPFVRARRRTLVLWSAGLALLGPALLVLVQVVTLEPYASGLGLVVQTVYSLPVWVALMLAGLAIGRSDLRRWMTAATVLGVGLVLSAVGYGAGAAYEAADGPTAGWEEPVDGIETVAPYDPGVELLPGEDVELTGMECEVYDDGWTMCAPEGELNTEYDEAEEYESWSASGWDAYSDAVAGAGLADRLLDALLDSSPHSGGSAEVVGSGGFAMALVGLLLLTGRWLRWPLIPIAAVGAMPLTAYSAQIVAIFVIGGPGGYIEDTGVFWATTAGLLAGCTLWIAFFGRGPLERVTKWVGDRMARG